MKHLILLSFIVMLVMDSFAITVFTAAVPSEGGSVSGGGVFAEDVSDAEVEAFPNAGYAFAGWYLDDECKNAVHNSGVGGYRQNPIHVDPRGNPTLYAKFIPPSEIHVEACALPINGGLVESVDAGGQTTFTAIPNAGYKFAGWFLDTGCHTIFSTDNYLKNPLSCDSSSNVVLNAKFVQALPSWAAGKWIGSLDFHRHGGEKVGDTATFDCDVDENGWWNSTCVWVNMGTRIVEATATNIINVTSTEVKIEGYYYSSDRFVWEMTLRIDGQSTFRAVRVENGNDICEGVCEKMVPMGPIVPSWVEGVWTGSLATAEFTCDISSNGAWKAICKWENMGTMIVSATATNIITVADDAVSISGYYYCGNRFDWVMDLRQDGESSFRATKMGDSDTMFGSLSKESIPEAKPEGGPYKETVDGVEWTFMVNAELKASIGSGTYGGDRAVPEATKGAIVIPSTLGGRVVTSIGCYAFRGRSGLTSVTIPSSITIISDSAFRECSGLTTMSIPSNVERIESSVFQECASLASVELDAGLKVIEHYAFKDCSALRTVNIPQTVEWVGSSILSSTQYWKDQDDGVIVLDGCALGLKGNSPTHLVIPNGVRLVAAYAFESNGAVSLSLPNSLRIICAGAFARVGAKNEIVIPLGVTKVGGDAFVGSGIVSITIPQTVMRIESQTFMNCKSLATVMLPEVLEYIGDEAFRGCKSLSNISIPDSIKAIGSNAFADCTGLWTVEIGSGIESIGGYAFEGCAELRSFGLYGAPTNLGNWAFGGYGEDYKHLDAIKIKDVKKWCGNEFTSNASLLYKTTYYGTCSKLLLNDEPIPNNLVIPNGVKRVGARTFTDLSLTSVSLSSTVTSIGEHAFRDCSLVTNVYLNAGLKSIEWSAFLNCTSLTRITLPETVESIGSGAFSGCKALCAVDFECPPPSGIKNAAIKVNATIRYNENYKDEWLPVIVACGWTNATAYQPNPSVPGDPGAVVTGDPENGYTIKPSGSNMNVVVSIPSGVEASKVTVEVSPNVLTVTPNGANVKMVKSTNDITSYLDIPSADPSGTIDLTQATVKSEIIKEALDPAKGAEIELNADAPSLTTSGTKPGLTYTLHEGATLQGMNSGDSKVGDGQPWTPNITVKGGASGFYSIDVTK